MRSVFYLTQNEPLDFVIGRLFGVLAEYRFYDVKRVADLLFGDALFYFYGCTHIGDSFLTPWGGSYLRDCFNRTAARGFV